MAETGKLIATRVIVSCDASPLGATAIDAAAALARGLDAELKGIFVEDINLIRTAALPFTQEVTSQAAQARRLQPDELQRLLERQAQSVRDVLRDAATALRLQWSFQVVRGPPLGSVLEAMQGLDLAVFGYAGRFAASLGAFAGRGATEVSGRRAVMVIFDGTSAAGRALSAAAALAQEMRGRLVVALIDAAAEASDLRALALEWIEQNHKNYKNHKNHRRPLFVTLKRRDAESVAQAAETYAPAVVLWGGVAGDADRAALATLVDVLRCPVILVA